MALKQMQNAMAGRQTIGPEPTKELQAQLLPSKSQSQISGTPEKSAAQDYLDSPIFEQAAASRKASIATKSSVSRKSIGSKKSKAHSSINKEPSKAQMLAMLGGNQKKPENPKPSKFEDNQRK